jgi:hypothetical protein
LKSVNPGMYLEAHDLHRGGATALGRGSARTQYDHEDRMPSQRKS